MRHTWSVLCGRVIIEAGTNKLNLIDLPEALFVNHEKLAAALEQSGDEKVLLPTGISIMSLFWLESDNEPAIEMRLTTRGPGEGDRRPSNLIIIPSIKDQKNTYLRVMSVIAAMTYYGYGIYEIGVQVGVPGKKKWRTVADIPLIVRPATSEELASLFPTSPPPPSGPTPAAPPGSSSPPGHSHPSRRRASRAPRPRGSS